jgi:hypothetical protein
MTDPDAIARRAYELFQARGSEPGHEMEDWLQAEAELQAQASLNAETGEELRSTEEAGEESEPALGQDRRTTRKRNGSARRVPRQPHTH